VGIELGDVIARIDHTVLDSHLDYYLEMLGHRPGEKVQLDLTRAGVARRVSVLLQDRVPPDGAELARRMLGIELAPLPERLARQVGLRTSTGMVIAKVERGGPADRIGIKPLDVLERLDRYYVADTDEVGQILDATKSGERIFVGILRPEGQFIYRDGEFLITR
jgi:S1-C subfamily serine protease